MYVTIADFAGVSPGTQGNPFGDSTSCCRCSKRYFQSGITAFPVECGRRFPVAGCN